MKTDNKQLANFTDVIYDTLMENKQFEQIDIEKVINQSVNANKGSISFEYEGAQYFLAITKEEI